VYYDGYRPGLRLVTVYQIGGRYYDNYRDGGLDRDHYADRYDDRYDH
jgi:hypothetical protein